MAFSRPRSYDDNVSNNVFPTLSMDFTSLTIATSAMSEPNRSVASPNFRTISDSCKNQSPDIARCHMISPKYIDKDDVDFRKETPVNNQLNLVVQRSNIKRPRPASSGEIESVSMMGRDYTISGDDQNASQKRSYDSTSMSSVRPRLAMRLQHKKWAEERDCLLHFFAQSLSESAVVTAQCALPSNESSHASAFASMMTCSNFWNEFVSMDEETKFPGQEISLPTSKSFSDPALMDFVGGTQLDILFNTVPRNIQDATSFAEMSEISVVITEAKHPYQVVYVNRSWVALCGYTADEVINKSLHCIQGTQTKSSILRRISRSLNAKIDCSARLTNYKKSGQPFENLLRIVPLKNRSGQVTHFLGSLEEI